MNCYRKLSGYVVLLPSGCRYQDLQQTTVSKNSLTNLALTKTQELLELSLTTFTTHH